MIEKMSRLEWMAKYGKEGVRLGIIQIDWAIKLDAYIIFLELIKKYPRSEAVILTAQQLGVNRSTVWRYLSAFDYVTPTAEEITLLKNHTRWTVLNSGNKS